VSRDDSYKTRRKAVLGRVCEICGRTDSELSWSNRKDMCSSCDRLPPREKKLAKKGKPSPEEVHQKYLANGKFKQFRDEEDQDDSGLREEPQKRAI
jgi:hypothetical protein